MFDILRLKKPIIRVDVANGNSSNFPNEMRINVNENELDVLLFRIPRQEIDVNNAISVGDNNPVVNIPAPIK
ncbi:hypothetical protein [Persicobacter sp. CCB-QB2]|uniref:hypothetical protein n=1 Tax=Persicobacter sp. CCB-QB2 TaxID=1561025 RepID=UPI0006A9C8C6|nr:hypothetical protein [Persicobacter sp. CCB-QB2]